MKRVALALLAVLALAGSFIAGRKSAPDATESYIPRRAWILTEAAKRAPPGQVLLIGDSLSERSGIVSLCGRPVFNAGVSAARLAEIAPLARDLARALKPTLSIIAVGTNDVTLKTDHAAWEAELIRLAGSMPKPLAIVQMAGGPLNPAMARAAKRTGAKLVPMPAYPTVEGVHQTPEGAAIWRTALESACD